jgi:hypothetical protein
MVSIVVLLTALRCVTLVRCHVIYIEKEDFLPAFTSMYDVIITIDNIKGGFRGSRLTLFNPNSVILKVDIIKDAVTRFSGS